MRPVGTQSIPSLIQIQELLCLLISGISFLGLRVFSQIGTSPLTKIQWDPSGTLSTPPPSYVFCPEPSNLLDIPEHSVCLNSARLRVMQGPPVPSALLLRSQLRAVSWSHCRAHTPFSFSGLCYLTMPGNLFQTSCPLCVCYSLRATPVAWNPSWTKLKVIH